MDNEFTYPTPVREEKTFTFPWLYYRDMIDAELASAVAVQKTNAKGLIWAVDSPEQPGKIESVMTDEGQLFKVCCP